MRYLKLSELSGQAAKLAKFKFKEPVADEEGNLPVWYDGVSDLLVNHRQAISVDPSGKIRFVAPDDERFTRGELIGHFGSMPEVVVMLVRDRKKLRPSARLIHHSKRNAKLPVNELATAMLMLNVLKYMLNPVQIHGPALFCHQTQINLQ